MMRACAICCAVLVALPAANAQSAPPSFSLVQELRLDGVAHDFSTIRSILVGRDGRVVVPLEQDHHFRVFDAAGKQIAAVGRAGSGPGEFDDVASFVGWLGDTLWVHDFNPRRLTLISPLNAVVRSANTVPPVTAAGSSDRPRITMTNVPVRALFADGTMLVRWGFGPPDPETFAPTDVRLVVVSPAGEVVREVTRLPKGAGVVSHRMPDGGVHNAVVPFYARPLEAISAAGDRVATLTTDVGSATYALTVVRTTGDTVFAKTYPFTGARISTAAKDSALATITSRQPETGIQLRSKAAPLVPDVYAPVTAVLFGEDDTVWLRVHSANANPRYSVLDGTGALMGQVVLPVRATLARASRTSLWTIERDADDVPSIVRYRIQARR
ncbi:MAG TPA: hypothetical protein VJR92_05585 [Gemmatimonadaceae bacterium]|nr:hypothetical protein [Gemmatimonadaceae bacterium]